VIPQDGATAELEFADEDAYYHRFLKGEYPGFVPGVGFHTRPKGTGD
jgi:hypothetical protein